MQTFLPYENFEQTAKCLDYRRLGKQRVECKQIILALTNPDKGWKNHPATKMWKNNVECLAYYGTCMCKEWINRGYKDSCLEFFNQFIKHDNFNDISKPSWLGDINFHNSHKSKLLQKNNEFYSQYGWCVNRNLEYIWPIN